jgi:hypothetical protein
MNPTNKFLLCCRLVMAIPFVILVLAAAFLAGANLVAGPVDRAGVTHPHLDKSPLKL